METTAFGTLANGCGTAPRDARSDHPAEVVVEPTASRPCIHDRESLIGQYSRQSGEAVSDSIKCATILAYGPRDIIVRLRGAQSSVRRSFPEMRNSIREFLLGQKGVSSYVPSAPSALLAASTGHAAMDVGAVTTEPCVHCKKLGHAATDC